MSENIESNIVHRVKQKPGNQSVVGAKDPTTMTKKKESNFENSKIVDSEFAEGSNKAVVREKIPLANDNKHIESFKHTYDALFKNFHATLMAEYNMMKEGYIEDF